MLVVGGIAGSDSAAQGPPPGRRFVRGAGRRHRAGRGRSRLATPSPVGPPPEQRLHHGRRPPPLWLYRGLLPLRAHACWPAVPWHQAPGC
eukprot:1103063-Alexandrium_andersonii.AAC.1